MKTLRKLGLVATFTFVLSLSALGGEIPTPPCSDPGETHGPPCSSVSAPTPGETSTPPTVAPGQVDTPPMADEVSLTEIASSVLLGIMSLF